jgi:hypothetical protein
MTSGQRALASAISTVALTVLLTGCQSRDRSSGGDSGQLGSGESRAASEIAEAISAYGGIFWGWTAAPPPQWS